MREFAWGAILMEKKGAGSSVFQSVCVYILAAELCERLAYYGLTGSLSIFLADQLGFESNTASELTSVFASLCYATPVLGGYLADARLGRFRCGAIM